MKRFLFALIVVTCTVWLAGDFCGVKWSVIPRILDPMNVTKLWTVEGFTANDAHFKSYWTKRAALEMGEIFKTVFPLVRLTNELTGQKTDLKDEYQKYIDEVWKKTRDWGFLCDPKSGSTSWKLDRTEPPSSSVKVAL